MDAKKEKIKTEADDTSHNENPIKYGVLYTEPDLFGESEKQEIEPVNEKFQSK